MPDLLPTSEYDTFLPDEVQQADRLDLRVEKAEMVVVGRYRDRAAASSTPMYFTDTTRDIVELRGWREADDGTPDTEAMPDDLVRRLRIVVADVVEWQLDYEDKAGITRVNQGSRSVTYDLSALPSRLFQPLEKYDTREPFSGLW